MKQFEALIGKSLRTVLPAAVLPALLILAGCGELAAPGSYDSGSILEIASIVGSYNGENTNQVDVVPGVCGTGGEVTPEFYSDHYADAVLVNRPWPNAEHQTGSTITIDAYQVQYIPIDVEAPALPTTRIPLVDTISIEPCEEGSACAGTPYGGLTCFDIRTKDNYIALGGDPSIENRYNVKYTFYGTNLFGYNVSATAGLNVTCTNYNYCE